MKSPGFLFIAFLAPMIPKISGQVSLTSDITGSFSCPGEPVRLSCDFNGDDVRWSIPPFSSTYFNGDPTPSITMPDPNIEILVVSGAPSISTRLRLLEAIETNVSCSDLAGSTEVLSVLVSTPPEPPTNVDLKCLAGDGNGRTFKVNWEAPTNPTFDIGFYLVEFSRSNGDFIMQTNTTKTSVEMYLSELGDIRARVYTYSTCAGLSRSEGVSSPFRSGMDHAYFAGILVPVFIGFGFIVATILISISFCYYCHKHKNAVSSPKSQEIPL